MSLNVKGTVSSKPDSKGMLFVQMGILRSKVHISDLQLIDEPVITGPALTRTGAGKIKMNKSASDPHRNQFARKDRRRSSLRT